MMESEPPPQGLALSHAALERVHACWDGVAALGPTQATHAIDRALADVAALIDAQNAFWLGAVRLGTSGAEDPVLGWRPRAVRYLAPSPVDRAFYDERTRASDRGALDESSVAHARQAGAYRARLLADLVSPEWFESPFFEYAYRARGVRDALFVVAPVNVDAESYFGFHRKGDAPRFTRAELDLAAHAIRGMAWLHRPALLAHGLLVATRPLSPRERTVLDLLLTELTEAQMAERLGLSERTTHHHVTAIFRKFGVKSRAGLMALWLGRPPAE